jgi:hypothetical protein
MSRDRSKSGVYSGRSWKWLARCWLAVGLPVQEDGRSGHSGVELSRETHPCGIGTVAGTYIHYTEAFSLAGNRLYLLSNGTVDCGHEPCHGSKLGRCATVSYFDFKTK